MSITLPFPFSLSLPTICTSIQPLRGREKDLTIRGRKSTGVIESRCCTASNLAIFCNQKSINDSHNKTLSSDLLPSSPHHTLLVPRCPDHHQQKTCIITQIMPPIMTTARVPLTITQAANLKSTSIWTSMLRGCFWNFHFQTRACLN
jgi:hypothetical protein